VPQARNGKTGRQKPVLLRQNRSGHHPGVAGRVDQKLPEHRPATLRT